MGHGAAGFHALLQYHACATRAVPLPFISFDFLCSEEAVVSHAGQTTTRAEVVESDPRASH